MKNFRKFALSILLALAFGQAGAADITSTGVTCSNNQPASITIDAGSNRQLFYSISEDNDIPNSDVSTIGTVAETETFTFSNTTPTNDHLHTVWIWNEAAVDSMSGTTVSGATGGGDNIHCWGVVDDADQTALGAWDFTSYTGASATPSVTSTSTSSDYVLISAIVAQSSRTIDDWDTFTERGEQSQTATHGLASGAGGDGTTTLTLSSSGETTLAALKFLNAAAGAPSFDVNPTVTATTNLTYTIGYTPNQTTTFYTVACNPGESVPTCQEIQTADCGTNSAESAAQEAVTGADTTQMTNIEFPRHDIYSCLSDGGGDSAVVSLLDENRAEDADETIVVFTSISGTSPFSLFPDTTGDTTNNSPIITGLASTVGFQVGHLIEVSAGFSGTGPFVILALTTSTITVHVDATSNQTNVSTNLLAYYNPAVATGDIVEHNDSVSCNAGSDLATWAVDGNFSYTATNCGTTVTTFAYCLQDVSGLFGDFITPDCWGATDVSLYIFNTAPVCQSDFSGVLVLDIDQAMSAVDYSVDCSDLDGHAMTFLVHSGTLPTGLSLSSAGVLTGTPTVENESGVELTLRATDIGGLADLIEMRIVYVIDTVTMPTLTGGDLDASLVAELNAFPWREAPEQTASFECDSAQPDDEVLTQNPTASTEVVHDVAITVTVANAGICLLMRRHRR